MVFERIRNSIPGYLLLLLAKLFLRLSSYEQFILNTVKFRGVLNGRLFFID
jgi:hypothetical protein